MRRRPHQLELRTPPTWGGRRDGAGRKPAPRRRRRVPPAPTRPRSSLPRSRHAASVLQSSVVAGRGRFHAGTCRVREGVDRPVPAPPFQRAARSRPLARRSRRSHGTASRHSGSHDSRRQGHQSRSRPPRNRLERQVPRSSSRDAAGGPPCARLRPPELPETSPRIPGARFALVRGVVQWLADTNRRGARTTTGGRGADVAGVRRMATARTDRCRRGAMSARRTRPNSTARPAARAVVLREKFADEQPVPTQRRGVTRSPGTYSTAARTPPSSTATSRRSAADGHIVTSVPKPMMKPPIQSQATSGFT